MLKIGLACSLSPNLKELRVKEDVRFSAGLIQIVGA